MIAGFVAAAAVATVIIGASVGTWAGNRLFDRHLTRRTPPTHPAA